MLNDKIMNLRDRFALAAMQALLTANPITYAEENLEDDAAGQVNYIVEEAYRMADAMINERNLPKGTN